MSKVEFREVQRDGPAVFWTAEFYLPANAGRPEKSD